MASTRLSIRNTVRRRIRDFYEDSDALGAAITTTTTTSITVGEGTKYVKGSVIQIDDEVMLVTADPSDGTLTVLRGYQGSVAATHDNSEVIYIIDKFSDFEINATLNEVIVDSFPDLFDYVTDETLTTENDKYTVTIPATLRRVSKAFENVGGSRKEWDELSLEFQDGVTLHLREYPSTNGATLRLVGVMSFAALTTDTEATGTFGGDNEETEYLVLEVIARLVDGRNLEKFEDPSYVATVKQEGSSMLMLQSLGTYFHTLARQKLDRVRKRKPIQLVGYSG